MRYPPSHKRETRARILDAAAGLLRSRGIDGTGVDAVMARAGLTAGGFYSHFRSKNALISAALETAAEQSARRWYGPLSGLRGRAFGRALLARYLSPEHRDDRAGGCILPSLGAEMPRATRKSRQHFEQRLRGLCTQVEAGFGSAHPVGREAILAGLALSVGGLVLSRAVVDRAFADELLAAARKGAAQLFGLSTNAGRRS